MSPRVLTALLGAAVVAAGSGAAAPAAIAADPVPAPVLQEDFSAAGLPAGWTAVEGDWTVSDGRLVGRSADSGQQSRITFGPHLDDYRVEATVRFESVADAARWAAVALDVAPDGRVPWWHAALRSGSDAANGLEFAERTAADGWNVTDRGPAPRAAGTGRDVDVAIEVRGARASWFFDGERVLETRSLRRTGDGVLGFVVNGSTVSFDDVRVTPIAPDSLVLPDDDRTVPRVVAHRGYSSALPENTLAAMAAGDRAGADWTEIDVQTSADGIPYVLHDGTVDRTTDGRGALNLLTAGALDGLDAGSWFSPAFARQPLPRLDVALEEVRRGSAGLLLEVKGPEMRAEVEAIVDAVRAAGLIGRTLLQSFDVQVLRDARELAPELRLGLLRGTLDADPVATARELGAIAYNPSWGAIAARTDEIARLNAAGIAVMPYTVDDPGTWATMRDAGVDAIITNRPGALVGWNARYAQEGPGRPAPEPDPAAVEILAPLAGARLTRDAALSLALDVAGVDDAAVTATLDGEPLYEGDAIDGDALALGRHLVNVSVRGEDGRVARATARFTMTASPVGLAHVVATAPRVGDRLRRRLLGAVLDARWRRVVTLVAWNADDLPRRVAGTISADARALGGR
jgi:glycerophosphoryl diester phosphodiesterase